MLLKSFPQITAQNTPFSIHEAPPPTAERLLPTRCFADEDRSRVYLTPTCRNLYTNRTHSIYGCYSARYNTTKHTSNATNRRQSRDNPLRVRSRPQRKFRENVPFADPEPLNPKPDHVMARVPCALSLVPCALSLVPCPLSLVPYGIGVFFKQPKRGKTELGRNNRVIQWSRDEAMLRTMKWIDDFGTLIVPPYRCDVL